MTAGLERKIQAIQRALKVNQPDPADGLDVLTKVGGFEIGGLRGAILAAAANRRPVVMRRLHFHSGSHDRRVGLTRWYVII